MIQKYRHDQRLQRSASSELKLYDDVLKAWLKMKGITDYLVKNQFIAHKLKTGEVEFSTYVPLLFAGDSVFRAYAWYPNHMEYINEFTKASNGLNQLMDEIHNKPEQSQSAPSYLTKTGDSVSLEFEGFSLGHTNTTLVDPIHLKIPNGYYAVTGASGSGKSSFLSKVRRERGNGIWATGQLTYTSSNGEMPDIYSAEQLTYIPGQATLRELITLETEDALKSGQSRFPRAADNILSSLLKEIGFLPDQEEGVLENTLTEVRNWRDQLSGGQLKKLTLLSVIVRQPEIAILDEIFTGLDEGSLKAAQAMLKKYLPDSLMLIVDHHAKNHQRDNFYSAELHLENRQLQLRPLLQGT